MYRSLAILVLVLTACSHAASPHKASAGPTVAMMVAREGTLPRLVHAYGRIGGSGGRVQLAFALAGTLRSLRVHPGDHVVAGATIATLDAATQMANVDAASADLVSARASLASARVDRTSAQLSLDERALARARTLVSAGVAARKDVDVAKAQLAADHAAAASYRGQAAAAVGGVAGAAARVRAASAELSRTSLRAPFSGVVSRVFLSPGMTVDPSTPVVAIVRGDAREASVQVADDANDPLRVGDPVTLTTSDGATELRGRISGIGGGVDEVTQLRTVTVAIVQGHAAVGTAVDAEIAVAQADGVLLTRDAVVEDPQSGERVVFVASKDAKGATEFVARRVRVLAEDGKHVVVAGVKPGEKIATRGAFALLAPPDGGDT